MRSYLDFEKPVAELEAKVEELRAMAATGDAVAVGEEIARLEAKASAALADLYAGLTPWQKTELARHPQRPHCLDYIAQLVPSFIPFSGDRKFGEDEAIVGGFGRFRGESICVIGHEKGSSTEDRLKHNFGMARPEGYRKAVRLMGMADRFGIPIISLIDTEGAYPGIGAEERGQAEAIARSTEACLALGVPNVAVIIGVGGCGGRNFLRSGRRLGDPIVVAPCRPRPGLHLSHGPPSGWRSEAIWALTAGFGAPGARIGAQSINHFNKITPFNGQKTRPQPD